MAERETYRRPIFRRRYQNTLGISGAAYFVSKSDEAVRNLPSPISDVIRLTQMHKIPENIDLVAWYGADVVGPATFYYLFRYIHNSRISASVKALAIATMFELIEFAARDELVRTKAEALYDLIDLGCYAAGVGGAYAIDKWRS